MDKERPLFSEAVKLERGHIYCVEIPDTFTADEIKSVQNQLTAWGNMPEHEIEFLTLTKGMKLTKGAGQ